MATDTMPRRRKTHVKNCCPSRRVGTFDNGSSPGAKDLHRSLRCRISVGSCGTEPNWFARTIPTLVSNSCRREFVRAFAAVRKQFDFLPPDEDEVAVDALDAAVH
jgi:hypothetical protein